MNGAEHYTEAERLLNWAAGLTLTSEAPRREQALAEAQVHATLAAAAASIEAAQQGPGQRLPPHWRQALGDAGPRLGEAY